MEKRSGTFSPLIFDYLKKYQDDPRSRVFAPLAEAYRKAGMLKEAVEIAQEGLRVHPQFIGGRVALARALFDQKNYEDVLNELSTIVREVPDNLVAQRLFAESALILGRTLEALGAYKMLLYFNPTDADAGRMVRELEAQSYDGGAMVLRTDPAPQKGLYSIKTAKEAIDGDESLIRSKKFRQIEFLQTALQELERYRLALSDKS
jgi:tetratricopeptide (TPR) repeat protein